MDLWYSREREHCPKAMGPLPSNYFSMKILCWNCSGVLNLNFCNILRDLVDVLILDMVVLIVTRLDGSRVDQVVEKLPFDNWHTT